MLVADRHDAPVSSAPQDPATDRWGIDTRWVDAHDQPRTVPAATLAVLRDLIGQPPDDLESVAPVVSGPGRPLGRTVSPPVEVDCEDGVTRQVDTDRLPADFPLGYHRFRGPDGGWRRLIVSPGRCWLPPGWRAWGLAVQLYATRSSGSWGIGDLADLRAVRTWAEQLGAGFVLVNPLHAVAPTLPQEASPYLPATRRWRNPLYLRVDEVPGADAVDLADPTAAGRELTGQPLIDRDAVWQLKRRVLEQVFAARDGADGFDDWRAAQGGSLQDHATWCALADTYGADWHDWPAALRRPDGPAVARFAAEHADAVAFHAWLQWAVDDQLARASGDLTVVQDLPIGVAGGGADAWAWQDLLADGVQVGAPPDVFNAMGQAWGSPPLIPWRVRADGYEAFVQSVRGTIAGAGGLRIDHVMGLFRLWWVPPGGSAVDGAYVRYPSDDLLDIVALESQRAGAVVVGEDLGTVEPGVRETLAARGLLSYRLLWFEDDDPAQWPETSMAAVTTHDLPTVAGLWSGADLAEQLSRTGDDDEALTTGREQLRSRLAGPAGLPLDADLDEAVLAAHRLLVRAPSTLVTATLEDAVGQERRPNMPGTTDRPNWSLPLPVLVDDLPSHPLARAVTDLLRAGVSPEDGEVEDGVS